MDASNAWRYGRSTSRLSIVLQFRVFLHSKGVDLFVFYGIISYVHRDDPFGIVVSATSILPQNRYYGYSFLKTDYCNFILQRAKGKFIDFNSNCSAVRCDGHSAYGYVEYRISEDLGRTYSDVRILPFSMDAFLDGIFTISVEKAVTCPDGSILAFCLRNTMLESVCCEPWMTPMAVRSRDGGNTWEAPFEVSKYPGRIYDALTIGDRIVFLEFKNEHFIGCKPEHKYSVFLSDDNGVSFREVELPIDGIGRGYGSLLYDEKGALHSYGYNVNNERYMDHAVSYDYGETWELLSPCYLNHGIRNPQTAEIDGVYVVHGREEHLNGFVFYFSENGSDWSEAFYAAHEHGACYYSNNLLLDDKGRHFLLIQYSEVCNKEYPCQVNVLHRTLEVRIGH